MKQIKSINILKQNKGAALIWALIVFVVLTILTASIAFVSRQNIFETAKQEERLQTYYIALAGIELTHAALMELNELNETDPNIAKVIVPRIVTNIIDKKSVSEDIDIKIDDEIIGTAEVTIDRVKTKENEKDIYWIRITSVGELKNKDTKVKSVMRINEKNYNMIVREN